MPLTLNSLPVLLVEVSCPLYKQVHSANEIKLNENYCIEKVKSAPEKHKYQDPPLNYKSSVIIPGKPKPERDLLKYVTVTDEDDGTQTFACKDCDSSFKNMPCFKQHYRHVHLKLRKKTFPCVLCRAEILPWLRAKHMEDAHGWEAPTCGVCGKKFAYPHQLTKHQQFYHMGESIFQCDQCGKSFPNRKGLKEHSYKHSDVRNLTCDYCSKAFKKMSYLKTHLKIHLNDKRYVCHVCSESFVQWGNLKYHMTRRHPDVNYEGKIRKAKLDSENK